MDLKKILESRAFTVTTWIIAVLIVLLTVFRLGMYVGFQKANFSYKWGENYHRNFAGPKDGFMKDFAKDDFKKGDFMDSHGSFGQILKVDGRNIMMKGRDEVEKVVSTDDKTSIMRFRDKIKLENLKVNEYIVVLGDSNDSGQIVAKLIRVMPDPKDSPMPPKDMPRDDFENAPNGSNR